MQNVSIIPYSVDEFNQIPILEETIEEFELLGGEAFVQEKLKPLLKRYEMHQEFSIGLIHRGFTLFGEDQKLVDVNGDLIFWNSQEQTDVPAEQLHPICWRIIRDRGLMPYEFVRVETADEKVMDLTDQKYQSFLREFVDTVEEAGFQNFFGLWKHVSSIWDLRALPRGASAPTRTQIAWNYDTHVNGENRANGEPHLNGANHLNGLN